MQYSNVFITKDPNTAISGTQTNKWMYETKHCDALLDLDSYLVVKRTHHIQPQNHILNDLEKTRPNFQYHKYGSKNLIILLKLSINSFWSLCFIIHFIKIPRLLDYFGSVNTYTCNILYMNYLS